MVFKLLDNGSQVSAVQWTQLTNPQPYTGVDYVSSFKLGMTASTDGSLQAIAPAPGRYHIAAQHGGAQFDAYVLVPPAQPAPDVRGIAVYGPAPIDRTMATNLIGLIKRAGGNWVEVPYSGLMEFDSGNFDVTDCAGPCSPAQANQSDTEWLIDEAHRQGMKVLFVPGLYAKYTGPVSGEAVYWAQLGQTWELPAVLLMVQPDLSKVMQGYSRFELKMAAVAQAHQVEALQVGFDSNAGSQPLLWSQAAQWKYMMQGVRQAFSGKIWVGTVFPCAPAQGAPDWTFADAMHGVGGLDLSCDGAASSGNAEDIYQAMSQRIGSPKRLFNLFRATNGLPEVWTDIYPVNTQGVFNLGISVFGQRNPIQDNQGSVDYIEAYMRVAASRASVKGLFLWAGEVWNETRPVMGDPMRQPALAAALANWWGGDTSAFLACTRALPEGVLFKADFEPSACPLDMNAMLSTGWSIVPDNADPSNHVIEGTGVAYGPTVPSVATTDYQVKLRMKLKPGPHPAGEIGIRRQENGDHYGVHFGFDQLMLVKHLSSQGQHRTLATFNVPEGIQLDRWYQFSITASGPRITVSIDGAPAIDATDSAAPFLKGGVNLNVGSGAGPATLDVDDFQLAQSSTVAAPINHTALWWNPSESGWGINFNQQGDTLFGTLFTYDAGGAPMWLVMSNGARQGTADTFGGDLFRTTGSPFSTNPFPPLTSANLTKVGTMSVAFAAGGTASLSYIVNGVSVTKAIQRQVFGARSADCQATSDAVRASATNYQDLWWNSSESGWGVNITHQGDVMFATLFTYGMNGQGLWLVMSAGQKQADGSYSGPLYRTHGAAFNAQPFPPIGAGDVTQVGNMRFRFTNGGSGTLDYSVDGVSVTKAITRQVFSNPVPICN